ncbi:MAG: transglycosylase family protein [Patescibacteria group bacterium]|nr:transglycosylase family protein [Patescibacteria group bacterium]MDE2438836.1 transglycosylase family protein [Patescibacteria group bacterium]
MNTLFGLGLALSLAMNQGFIPMMALATDSTPPTIQTQDAASATPAYASDSTPVTRIQTKDEKINSLIERLISCESGGKNIKVVDSNGYYSYGILQFQKGTWDEWSAQSGITGDPMVPGDAIRMAHWAIANGLLGHWSCAHKLGLTE